MIPGAELVPVASDLIVGYSSLHLRPIQDRWNGHLSLPISNREDHVQCASVLTGHNAGQLHLVDLQMPAFLVVNAEVHIESRSSTPAAQAYIHDDDNGVGNAVRFAPETPLPMTAIAQLRSASSTASDRIPDQPTRQHANIAHHSTIRVMCGVKCQPGIYRLPAVLGFWLLYTLFSPPSLLMVMINHVTSWSLIKILQRFWEQSQR